MRPIRWTAGRAMKQRNQRCWQGGKGPRRAALAWRAGDAIRSVYWYSRMSRGSEMGLNCVFPPFRFPRARRCCQSAPRGGGSFAPCRGEHRFLDVLGGKGMWSSPPAVALASVHPFGGCGVVLRRRCREEVSARCLQSPGPSNALCCADCLERQFDASRAPQLRGPDRFSGPFARCGFLAQRYLGQSRVADFRSSVGFLEHLVPGGVSAAERSSGPTVRKSAAESAERPNLAQPGRAIFDGRTYPGRMVRR